MHGDVNQSDGGSYSTCKECSIQIVDESTPLLARPRTNANFFVMLLLFFTFCVGLAIGIYLLIEDLEWESEQPYPMTEDFILAKMSNSSQFSWIIDKVEIIEILGPPCNNGSICLDEINQFSWNNFNQYGADCFNFYIDANATMYRYLDFDHSRSDCDNNTLTISLSRVNTELSSVSDSQKYKVEEIIDNGIKYNKLRPCCMISVTKDINWLQTLNENIQNDINQRYNCTSRD